jgi:alkylation response protein AidB-like acyl-CoA dehydrogenase
MTSPTLPAVVPAEDELRTRIRAWIATEVEPFGREHEHRGETPRALFESFADNGFLGIGYPADLGGRGGDFVQQLVVAEELYYAGWGGVALSLLGHSGVCLQPLVVLGTERQRERYVRPALAGRCVLAVAVTEVTAGSDVGGVRTRAVRTSDGWSISGGKAFVTLGSQADVVLVAARTSERPGARGLSLFLVPRGTAGLSMVRCFDKLGMRSSATAELAFSDCVVPDDALLGEEGRGFVSLMRQFQAERLMLAVGALAVGRRAADEAVAYVRERHQFGRPLASFQALRHRIADATATLTALRTFVFATGRRYAAGEYPVADISMAKLLAARAGCDVADDMLQMFGGWGYVADFPMERLWRDVRLMRLGGGTDEIMREVIARQLGLDAAGEAGSGPASAGWGMGLGRSVLEAEGEQRR